jgi:hypothetical protein
MEEDLQQLFHDQGGVATSAQILRLISRQQFDLLLKSGPLQRIWSRIYSASEPDDPIRLRGLDLSCGTVVPVCLATAAAIYGFDVQEDPNFHVLNPPRRRTTADGRRAPRDVAGLDCRRSRA